MPGGHPVVCGASQNSFILLFAHDLDHVFEARVVGETLGTRSVFAHPFGVVSSNQIEDVVLCNLAQVGRGMTTEATGFANFVLHYALRADFIVPIIGSDMPAEKISSRSSRATHTHSYDVGEPGVTMMCQGESGDAHRIDVQGHW